MPFDRNVGSFPHPKYEKNKRCFGVNQKLSPGLARLNFKFSSNSFNPGRFRSLQTKMSDIIVGWPQ